jgi:rhodanese-related sulfurtransferase
MTAQNSTAMTTKKLFNATHRGTRLSFRFCAFLLLMIATVSQATVPLIRSAELRRLELIRDESIIIVDVRPEEAYAKGHIQRAKNFPASSVARAGLPLTAHIIVYCSEPTCALSMNAAKQLLASGYKKVELLDGGFGDWLKKGYPATTGSTPKNATTHRVLARGKDLRNGLKDGIEFALDVRPAGEFKSGHVAKAYNAPLEELAQHYIDLPKNKKIVVYDRVPGRAKQATAKLKSDGFDAEELAGGLAGWTRRGNKLVTK